MKTANRIFMGLTGLVLLFAAVTKCHQLLTEPIISKSFWASWEFFLIQVPLELGLGIWLLCGLFRKAAWLIAVVSFGGFIAVILQMAVTGAASCGCFGKVQVNPWITLLAIDVPLFLGLLLFRPKGEKLLPPPWPTPRHFFGVAIPTFILMAVIMPVLIFNKPPDTGDGYIVVRHEEWTKPKPVISEQAKVVQTPDEETGEEWPLLEHIDIADSLRSQIAIVLLYHRDCPDCREAIPLYDRMSRELAGNEEAIRIAFIEVPPYAPEEDDPVPAETTCLKGRLDASIKWYFTTPLVVVTEDGSVVKSWEVEVPQLDEILNVVFSDD